MKPGQFIKHQDKLAIALGISRPTLRKFIDMPNAPQPHPQKGYNIEAVRAFIQAQSAAQRQQTNAVFTDENFVKLRMREVFAKTQRQEFDLAVKKGEYVARTEIAAEISGLVSRTVTMFRRHFENELPSELVGLNAHQIAEKLKAAVTITLRELYDEAEKYKTTDAPKP